MAAVRTMRTMRTVRTMRAVRAAGGIDGSAEGIVRDMQRVVRHVREVQGVAVEVQGIVMMHVQGVVHVERIKGMVMHAVALPAAIGREQRSGRIVSAQGFFLAGEQYDRQANGQGQEQILHVYCMKVVRLWPA